MNTSKPEPTPGRQTLVMRRIATLFLVFHIATICSAQNQLPPIKWRTLAEGTQSAPTQSERHFMYTDAAMQTYMGKTKPVTNSNLKVDWTKEFVIALHTGSRKTGGYRIYVETIDRTTSAAAAVRCVEIKPAPGTPVTEAFTSPWVMIAIERTGIVDWQFTERSITPKVLKIKCRCGCTKCGCGRPPSVSEYANEVGIWGRNSYGGKANGPIPWSEFLWGRESNVRSSKTFTLRSEEAFRTYWEGAFGTEKAAPRSQIDWNRDQLLAIHLGETRGQQTLDFNGFARVAITGLVADFTILDSRLSRPGPLTSPFIIVRTPRIVEGVTFRSNPLFVGSSCLCGCTCGHR